MESAKRPTPASGLVLIKLYMVLLCDTFIAAGLFECKIIYLYETAEYRYDGWDSVASGTHLYNEVVGRVCMTILRYRMLDAMPPGEAVTTCPRGRPFTIP